VHLHPFLPHPRPPHRHSLHFKVLAFTSRSPLDEHSSVQQAPRFEGQSSRNQYCLNLSPSHRHLHPHPQRLVTGLFAAAVVITFIIIVIIIIAAIEVIITPHFHHRQIGNHHLANSS
jgi:hypothetical protein